MHDNVSIASYAFHGLLREGAIDVFAYLETVKYRYDARPTSGMGCCPPRIGSSCSR